MGKANVQQVMSKLSMVIALFVLTASAALADQQLIFSLRTHNERTFKSQPERDAESKSPGAEKDKPIITDSQDRVVVTLGTDYLKVDAGGQISIFDFSKNCQYVISTKEKEYRKINQYAFLYFRIAEFQNRQFIGGILDKSGAAMDMGSRFTNESIFGINDPHTKGRIVAVKQASGTGTKFTYENIERAFYSPSKYPIDPAYVKTYKRAMPQLFKIHPSIRSALLTMNVPKTLKYSCKDAGTDQTFEYILQSVGTVPASNPSPPAGYALKYPEELQPIYDAIKQLSKPPAFISKNDVDRTVDDAIAHDGNFLDALLSSLEYTLSTGNAASEAMHKLAPKIKLDSDCNKFLSDYGSKSDGEEIRQCLESMDSIPVDKLKRAYVIDIMRANDYELLGNMGKARSLMISVLAQHPLIINVYHDLGMNYLKTFDMEKAWNCFDLADELKPNHPQMASIHFLEKEMRKDYSEFF